MSKTTKRKHVTKEALTEYYVPEGEEEIVKIIAGRGNNLHEVESADGRKFLVSMPTKFRKNLWIKRGDFVVVNPIKEGNKVMAEIVYVLYNKQIKYLQNEGNWPKQFLEENNDDEIESHEKTRNIAYEGSSEEEDDDLLFKNPNRREFNLVEDSDSSDEEDSEETEEDGDKEDLQNELTESNKEHTKQEELSSETLAEKLSSIL